MPEPLNAALTELRPLLLDADHLVKAVAAGRRRGAVPGHVRAELRPVQLKAGRRVQLVTTDGKDIFAQGTFYAYDSLLNTAWYVFDVKKKGLGAGPLVLKITTQVIVNQQVKPVTIEKPIPAGTFLGSNLR